MRRTGKSAKRLVADSQIPTLVAVAGVAFLRSPAGCAQELFWKEMSANSLVAAELAPGSSLSLDAAIARSRKFMAETAGHAFVRFTLVNEVIQAYPAPKPPRITYNRWIQLYYDLRWLHMKLVKASGYLAPVSLYIRSFQTLNNGSGDLPAALLSRVLPYRRAS
ncbi:MAG: hypothetical protein IT158_01735 [Bryobacterales bacterium]|nr:hypothetical protein [Bryobacterales bacterium]